MGHEALLGVARLQGEVSCAPMLHSGRPTTTLPLLAAESPPLQDQQCSHCVGITLAADCCCGRRSADLDLWLAPHRGACKPLQGGGLPAETLWLLWLDLIKRQSFSSHPAAPNKLVSVSQHVQMHAASLVNQLGLQLMQAMSWGLHLGAVQQPEQHPCQQPHSLTWRC